MIEVDVRGFSCPIPVAKTKRAMEENPDKPLTVLVDTGTSRDNVARLAKSHGYSVEIQQSGDGFRLALTPSLEKSKSK